MTINGLEFEFQPERLKPVLRKSYTVLQKTKNNYDAKNTVKNFEFYLKGRIKIFYNKNLNLVIKKVGLLWKNVKISYGY